MEPEVDPEVDSKADKATGERAPGLVRQMIQWVVPPEDRDVVDAELLEHFVRRAACDGGPAARRWYRRQVLGFVLRSGA